MPYEQHFVNVESKTFVIHATYVRALHAEPLGANSIRRYRLCEDKNCDYRDSERR